MPDLNPQPLPPKIEFAALTEAISGAVMRAIETQTKANSPFRNPRIICGFIIEPQILQAIEAGDE
jgi:hypothetical protein